MKVKSVPYSSLQNMEHFQFASHVLAMCKEANIEKVNVVLPQLEAAITEEDKALNQPRTQEGTAELNAFDKEREKAFRALKLLVELNLQSSDTATLKATTIIKEVMACYPGINKANADKKTGIIKNLIPDLKDTAIMPSITKINAKPYIDRLEKANTSFDNLFRSRLKTTTPKGICLISKK